MSARRAHESEAELERYELTEPAKYRFALGRRGFLQVVSGGIAVVLTARGSFASQESGDGRRADSAGAGPEEIGAWLHIDESGAITAYTGKVEVGQNARTSLAQAVAEELRAPLEAVQLVMGDTDRTPYDRGTFGSRTTPDMGRQLRRVAATARELLLDLAADMWGVDRRSVAAEEGVVRHSGTGRSVPFAAITQGRKLTKAITEDIDLRPAESWTACGQPATKRAGRSFVTGAHRFTSDLVRPRMLYGRILRPPAFGASVHSIDLQKAEEIEGVTVVHEGDFVGVAAPSEEIASRAVEAIRAEWNRIAQPSREELFTFLKENPVEAQGFRGSFRREQGSIAEGLTAADHRLESTYTVDYIAHAPLEPRAAVAEWENGTLTVWTGTQRPFGVRSELAEAFRIPEERVRVLVPDTGSAYGGKHTGEAAIEAARLAKAAGRPVKLVWTREEEFTWAYFRPAGIIEVRSGVRRDGTITAWEFHNYNSGASAIESLYRAPHQRIEFHPARSPLRQGSYRGLAATANHFARESHIDELAHAVGMDPLAFRQKNLTDERLLAVLGAAARGFRWDGREKRPGRGFGIAGGCEKGGYVATAVEVATEGSTGTVRIERVVTAFECGAIVNPDGLRNQVEGAVIMSIGGALFESVDFANGEILNPRFSSYRVPRFGDVPHLETILLDRKDIAPAGAGETPIVGLAPAVANALFDATGTRLRSLPLAPEG